MYQKMILITLLLFSNISSIQADPINCSYNEYCNNCVGSNKPFWCYSCTRTYRCGVVDYRLREIPRVVELPPQIPKLPKIPKLPNDPRCLSCPPIDLRINPDIQRQ